MKGISSSFPEIHQKEGGRLQNGWNATQLLLSEKVSGRNWSHPQLTSLLLLLVMMIVMIIPHICHGRHGRRPCKFFLAGVNFYIFNAKNWHFFTDLTQKIGVFGVNFILQKFCLSMTNDK